MSAALKLIVQKLMNYLARKTRANNTSAHTKNIRVVVKSCVFRGKSISANRCADTVNLIRAHRHSDPRAANQNALVTFAVHDFFADLYGNIGIIDFFAVTAEIDILNALLFKIAFNGEFQIISAVVTTDCNHNFASFFKHNKKYVSIIQHFFARVNRKCKKFIPCLSPIFRVPLAANANISALARRVRFRANPAPRNKLRSLAETAEQAAPTYIFPR